MARVIGGVEPLRLLGAFATSKAVVGETVSLKPVADGPPDTQAWLPATGGDLSEGPDALDEGSDEAHPEHPLAEDHASQ